MNRMTTARTILTASTAAAALAAPALAQSTVSEANKYCWGENIGYINWRDGGSPAGSQGAVMHATFLSGFIWAENVGWINLGDGTPGAGGVGSSYGNVDGSDAGVNLDPTTGRLSGLAWGENIGWINFGGGAMATPASPARVSPGVPRRLLGHAWGENVGWINLDSAEVFVEFVGGCRVDWNRDGVVNSGDISAFLTDWIASVQTGDTLADFDGSGASNSGDISAFLTAWIAAVTNGCA